MSSIPSGEALRLDNMPPEILGLIVSKASIIDLFSLKLAGSRYVTAIVRDRCHLSRDAYFSALQADDRRRTGRERSPLEITISRGQTVLLMECIEKKVPFARRVRTASRPERRSVEREIARKIRTLPDSIVRSAFHYAARYKVDDLLRFLLDRKWIDIDVEDDDGMTALHLASRYGCEEVVQLLLSRRARVNQQNNKGQTALHFAALGGHEGITRLLLLKRASIDIPSRSRETALHLAAQAGNSAIVSLLLDRGANSWLRSSSRHSPNYWTRRENNATGLPDNFIGKIALHYASQRGHSLVAKLLLEHPSTMKHDPKARAEDVAVAVHWAAQGGFSETVSLLLEYIDNLKSKASLHTIAIQIAEANGHKQAVKTLSENRINLRPKEILRTDLLYAARKKQDLPVALRPDIISPEGETLLFHDNVLHLAVKHLSWGWGLDMVETFLDQGAKLEAEYCGDTPLLSAIRSENLRMFELLLGRGAKIHARDSSGNTPLHVAVFCETFFPTGPDYMAKVLLDAGADIRATNNAGQNVLHVLERQNIKKLNLLLSYGADKESRDVNGRTALHTSVERGWLDHALCLLEEGSNVHAQDYQGMTALHLAAMKGSKGAVKFLLARGADIDCQDYKGKTPLHHAATIRLRQSRYGTYHLLLSLGASASVRDYDGRTGKDLYQQVVERAGLKKFTKVE
ncbi:hypothetical protein FQN54_009741 [Arachnomyces sp. PD_36]|nr:hypothetical protein FQN54_009741 [Arachnomyces sp. PD_36]